MIAKKQKVALITGVTCQDGSYLVDLLLQKDYQVIGIKRRTSLINTDRVDHVFEDTGDVKNFHMVYGNMIDAGSLHRT